MDYAKESLKLHEKWKGKIEVVATVPVQSKDDLSLAYTPGVAQPCLEIQKDPGKSYTRRIGQGKVLFIFQRNAGFDLQFAVPFGMKFQRFLCVIHLIPPLKLFAVGGCQRQ